MSVEGKGAWPPMLVLAIWGAGLGSAAQYGKISLIFEELGRHYGVTGAALGFAVSTVSLMGIVLGVVAGLLAAKLGRRRVLLVALGLGAVLSLYQALLPAYPLFLLSRAVEGASHLAIVVTAPAIIATITPERARPMALALWGTFFGVAFALISWLGLPLVDAWGIPALFLAHGIYMAVFAVLLAITLPPDPPISTGPPRSILADHIRIYTSARISAPAIGWLFYTFCFVSLITLLPAYIDPVWRRSVTGAMPLIGIVTSMTIGVYLLQRLQAITVIELGFLSASVAAIGLWLFPGSPIFALALFAALGLSQGASFAAVPQLNSDEADRLTANGALAQMGNLGNGAGTPVMAAIAASAGYSAMMAVAVLVLLAGLAAHRALTHVRNRQETGWSDG